MQAGSAREEVPVNNGMLSHGPQIGYSVIFSFLQHLFLLFRA